jgi:acetolactate synthase-1/2/3 large subunit
LADIISTDQHNTEARSPHELLQRQKIGAQIVVETLEAHGVTHVFGIPGAKIDAVFNTLVDSKIKTIVCRHEQNAAFIAGGIGRMTGRAGVAIATSGPGTSNLVTGLATANSEGDPMIGLGGAVPVSESLKQVHQTMDSVQMCRPITKYSASADSPESISEVLSNAFRSAESGRPGAAFVSLPQDVMTGPTRSRVLTPPVYAAAGPGDCAALEEASRLISEARAPVVLLGMMASKPQNASAISALIARTKLPVVGTFQATGVFPHALSRYFGGRVGQAANQPADQLLSAADVIVSIGYDPVEYDPSIWNRGRSRTIVHIDAVPSYMDRNYTSQVELVGDISSTVAALASLLGSGVERTATASILEAIVAQRDAAARENAKRGGTPIHPLRLVAELQALMSDDITVCTDMGSFHLWMARHLYAFRARQFLMTNGQQTLGVALPWAIAATVVRPHEKVLSISGDGGFLFSAMELETAVRLQSHIVHLMWIDGTYNMVGAQEQIKYGRQSGVDFGPVDPIKYAEAFGAKGLMIGSADEIAPVMKKAFDTAGPVIVGVHVDYSENARLFENVDQRNVH